MFGLTRRPACPKPVAPAPALFEPLESRQLMSAVTPALTGAAGPLRLDLNRSTLPAAQIAGARINGVVLVTLTNSTTILDRGTNTFTVYASSQPADGTEPAVGTADRVLGKVSRRVALAGGRSFRLAIPVRLQAAPLNGEYRGSCPGHGRRRRPDDHG